MSKELIMHADRLQEIMHRLRGGIALLYALYEAAGVSGVSETAIGGMCDLLECICRDFQTDVDAAEDCAENSNEAV